MEREDLITRLRYTGSALHKRRPGDYGFQPPFNPRAVKDLCDAPGNRPILSAEAQELFAAGIRKGMFSQLHANGVPKYVWAVDQNGDVYEAKTAADRETDYHGYRLGDDEAVMRRYVLDEWKRR
jgi:hypothetical protein